MRTTILVAMMALSLNTFAKGTGDTGSANSNKEKTVAVCKLTGNDGSKPSNITQNLGTMSIKHFDNGDEGILTFSMKLHDGSELTFADNIQDEGLDFLKSGSSSLYTSLQGIKSKNGFQTNAAAIYLKNDKSTISGMLKVDFLRANVLCKAVE